MSNEDGIAALLAWTAKQVEAQAKHEPAYVTLSPREGQSYPQRGRVNLSEAATLEGALRDEIQDILRSAEAEDRTVTRIKVIVYAAKGSAQLASSVFRIAPGTDEAPGGGGGASARDGELVAGMRELRQTVASLALTNQQLVGLTIQVAAKAIDGANAQSATWAEAQKQVGELTGALIVAQEGSKTVLSEVKEVLIPLLPAIAARLSTPSSSP